YSQHLKTTFPEPPVINMPEHDYEKLRKASLDRDHLKKLRYAKMIDVDIMVKSQAQQIYLGGGVLYRLAISSKGAYSLSLVFSELKIPEGAKLFVYNQDQSHVKGAFTERNNKASGVLPLAPVRGEKIIVEYFEPDNSSYDGKLKIGKVGHGFLDIYSIEEEDPDFGASCEDIDDWDINCPAGDDWQTVKHAVLKLVSNGWLCTGSLINNVHYNKRPYLLTANHCLNNQDKAEESVFIFNYESPDCKGTKPDTSDYHSMSGANLISTTPENDQLDFTLLELSESVPINYKPYFAGWSLETKNIRRSASIHHPEGDVKKISIDSNTVEISTYPGGLYNGSSHWLVKEWDLGTTQGGSSGAPLFNKQKRIIGDLSGGEATCDDPVNDYFARFDRSWDDFGPAEHQLKAWLDPENTGFNHLDGYLPYDSIPSHLKIQYEAPDIRLYWNPPLNEQEVLNYEIYRNGELLDNNVSKTGYTDTDVVEDTLYRYKVRAYLDDGTYTDYTEEIPFVPLRVKSLPFTENFPTSDTLPEGWYEYNYKSKSNWDISTGAPGNQPDTAAQGEYNLVFQGEEGDSSRMITPPIDMNGEEYIHLSYFVAIPGTKGNADHLNLYIRYADTLNWHLVRSYRDTISGWRSDSIYLPKPSSNYRLAFEGVAHNGEGIVLDAVNISRDTSAFTPKFEVSNDTVCEGDFLYFMIEDGDTDEDYSYFWDFGYGASSRYEDGPGPHTIRYTYPGEKTVRLTVNGIYQTTRKGAVIVDPLPPKPDIEVNGDTLSIENEGDSIQWHDEYGPIEGATDSIYIATEGGEYRVEVINPYGCSVFSDVYTDINVSLPPNKSGELKIYPIPAEERIHVQYSSNESQKARLSVVNTSGTTVKSKEVNLHTGKNRESVSIADLSPGVYVVRLYQENGATLHSRFIKE
ncbi:MAG: T9SS type A sorting domain-containing protein, partial [Bacteroidota bacterium]